MNEITVRYAELTDSEALAILISQLGYPTSTHEMQDRLRSNLSHPDYHTWVAITGDEIVGVIGLHVGLAYDFTGPYVRILVLAIREGHRGQGIGSCLLVKAEERARSLNCHRMLVNSGNRPERTGAHAFYAHHGFVARGTSFSKGLS